MDYTGDFTDLRRLIIGLYPNITKQQKDAIASIERLKPIKIRNLNHLFFACRSLIFRLHDATHTAFFIGKDLPVCTECVGVTTFYVDGELRITGSRFPKVFSPGDVITAINEKPVDRFLDAMIESMNGLPGVPVFRTSVFGFALMNFPEQPYPPAKSFTVGGKKHLCSDYQTDNYISILDTSYGNPETEFVNDLRHGELYLRVPSFSISDRSYEQWRKAMALMATQFKKVKRIVLNLRGNRGGSVGIALMLCDLLFGGKSTRIFYDVDRINAETLHYHTARYSMRGLTDQARANAYEMMKFHEIHCTLGMENNIFTVHYPDLTFAGFNGPIDIWFDEYSNSASLAVLDVAAKQKNVRFYGIASASDNGSGGELFRYLLPRSNFEFALPSLSNVDPRPCGFFFAGSKKLPWRMSGKSKSKKKAKGGSGSGTDSGSGSGSGSIAVSTSGSGGKKGSRKLCSCSGSTCMMK